MASVPAALRAALPIAKARTVVGAATFPSSHRLAMKWSQISGLGSSSQRSRPVLVRAAGDAYGENPEWSDDDFVVVGLGHCFMEDSNGKLKDYMVIEPIAAGALECMENGGKTCYRHIVGTTLGVVLQQDPMLLPEEFHQGHFGSEFDFRAKCASRNWKRDYPREKLRALAPLGVVRSEFNLSLDDKRVLNMVNVVTDEDNIKQDLSIDVYGRAKEEEKKDDFAAQISSLYNV